MINTLPGVFFSLKEIIDPKLNFHPCSSFIFPIKSSPSC